MLGFPLNLTSHDNPYDIASKRDGLTLRCKAIRGRILGEGAAWLGLGGVWWLAGLRPHQTTPNPTKNLFARAYPWTKLRAMRRMVRDGLAVAHKILSQ